MSIGVQYDVTTGEILATVAPPVEGVEFPEGVAQVIVDDGTAINPAIQIVQNQILVAKAPLDQV